MKINYNTARIRHLLDMYRLSISDFLIKISEDVKKKLSESDIFGETHLSKLALYTHLLFNRQIHQQYHVTMMSELHDDNLRKQQEFEREKDRKKELGIEIPGEPANPIQNPINISIIRQAYFSGVLDEYDVFRRLNIKPEI